MTTERLYLREITIEDLDKLYDIYSGKGITDYMEGLYEDRSKEEEFTREYIRHMYGFYEYGIWVVCLRENDEIIGRAGISNREVDGENKLELGYVIGVPYQRKGYAYEACSAICNFVKDRLCETELVCFMDRDNRASVKLAEKLGFVWQQNIVTEENDDNGRKDIFAYYKKKL